MTSHDSETPAEGQQIITVCAFIYKEEKGEYKLFSPRRAKTKKLFPDVYELPGGHIEFGEKLIPGLKREIKEEFGIDINVEDCFYAMTYINKVKRSHSVEILYFATLKDRESKIKLDPNDHSEYTWLSLKEYKKAMRKNRNLDYQGVIEGFKKLNLRDNS